MFLVGMFSWWYGNGWRGCVASMSKRLAVTADYFSIDLLLRTLFAPFRQISAGQVNGPIGVQLHAFFDKTISRLIGAFVRSFMIILGLILLLIQLIINGVVLILWPLLPAFPVIGIVFTIAGVQLW